MTSYNEYHKKHNEKKKEAGYKKVTFELNSEEQKLSNKIKQDFKDKGHNKTNKDLFIDGLMFNKDKIEGL